ncbi:MAG: AAA family ATPase [Candidatus Diapherotrites archaeon]|uniref:ORC1-type DNA replication protein n=1 Tax=Candidatus Iainarchaeum sp. TaxID=3101447 RepID=A0A8T3YM33_9ARCH|nr:AAA family ATPase [Candidatus Diapherotrites archaeon]
MDFDAIQFWGKIVQSASATANIFEREFARETIFADRAIITPHYTPKELPFREPYINNISSMLAQTIKGKKADNIFIYGKVGTGKTSVTKHVMQQLLEFASSKNVAVEGNYVNCRNHNSKYRILIKAAKDFYPEENFLGFSAAFVYEKLVDYARKGRQIVLVLDEIDKVKDLDDLVYGLTRANDEMQQGGISIIGISNNVMFKDRLDPRTKSSLCEKELVFPPYNAPELTEILKQRTEKAFSPGTVDESAVSLAAAIAAQESGDARTAVKLMLRAGEIADRKGSGRVTDAEVKKAKKQVDEEIIFDMVSTLPQQQQLVLYSIAALSLTKKPQPKITGEREEGVLFSGEVYDEYCTICRKFKETPVSARWYREYISELEMFGLILSTASGKGIKGQTTLIKLGFEAQRIKAQIERELSDSTA